MFPKNLYRPSSNSNLKRIALHRNSCKVRWLPSRDPLDNVTVLQIPVYGAVLNKAGTIYSLSRGEGAPQGRERNAGENIASKHNLSGLLKRRKYVGSLSILRICKVTARIPLQSKIGSPEPIFDSSPPGEAIGSYRYPTI